MPVLTLHFDAARTSECFIIGEIHDEALVFLVCCTREQCLRKAYNQLYSVVTFGAVVLEQIVEILLSETMLFLLFVEEPGLFFFSF